MTPVSIHTTTGRGNRDEAAEVAEESERMSSDWRQMTIGEAAEFTSKPRGLLYTELIRIPFVPMALIPVGGTYVQDHIWKSGKDIRSGNYFEKGDCLIAKITPCFENGKQGIARDLPADFGFASTELIPFRGRDGISNKYFLFYFLLEATTRRQIAQKMEGATGRQRIPISVLRSWPITLPSLPEQKTITTVLLKIQRAIETQEEIIQLLRDLKRSTMQHLFTHGLRGEKTKMTEIGEIPESWDIKVFGDIASISAGGTPSRANPAYWQNGTIPWVKTGEINYRAITSTEEHITHFGLESSSAKLLPSGTLLLAMYGQGITRGRVGLLSVEAATNQACAAIIPMTKTVRTRFLYHYLTWSYARLRARGHGAQQANLNAKIVARFPVVLPLPDEQAGLAAALDSLDCKATHHESKKAALQDLFKTTLNKLMTGEIRVDDLDIDVSEVEA